MAKLKAAARNALPASSFGLPGKRAYPMPDKSHAANAKARASQAVKAGRMSESTEAKIDAKADRKLGEKGGSKKQGRATAAENMSSDAPKPSRKPKRDDTDNYGSLMGGKRGHVSYS